MNRTEYKSKRDELLAQAQALIDGGKLDKFETKKREIETLDAQFDKEAKAAANARTLSE